MSETFLSLLEKIRSVATSGSDKGTQFEELILQFLKNDPGFQDQFSDVWLWNDFPERGKETDTGIDIVAKNRNTEGFTAIQCKFYGEESTIDQNNIASFVTRASKRPFTRGIVVSTTTKWTKHADSLIADLPIQKVGIEQIENSRFDWAKYLDSGKTSCRPCKELCPHQTDALSDVCDKIYWEQWAKEVADIVQKHIESLTILSKNNAHELDFAAFLDHLRSNLNDSISESEAIEMLAQHIITKPIFTALFGSDDFSKNNPVSLALDKVVALLEDAESVSGDEWRVSNEDKTLTTHHSSLSSFYESVRLRVAGATTAEGKQKIVIELYDKFFKTAFPKQSEKLGIVYTPVEVVDWIIKAVDQALRQEFGEGIGAKDVHVLDPFTGTGTFIVRLLQSGLIAPKDLKRKYENEIHANEIILLAYYIAAINIENTFREVLTTNNLPLITNHYFPGIVHTDTFTMTQEKKLVDDVNSERAKRQRETPITVIIGNPPYSAGATEFADGVKRTTYNQLEDRVRQTYAEHSVAKNKNSLYDSYIRAFRWSCDRIGASGVICYITNAGWLDGNAMDGFRKCLSEEFTDIYVFNLRGGIKGKIGDTAKREGQNVFDIMAGVAITLLIRNPAKAGKPCCINYYEFDDYLKRKEKLDIIKKADGLNGIEWDTIVPNVKQDWLNQRCDEFDKFIGIDEVFRLKTLGVQTNRDAWVYNFSKIYLADNVNRMIEFYNEQVKAYNNRKEWDKELSVNDFIVYEPRKISWSRSLKNILQSQTKLQFSEKNIVSAMYRPFCKTKLYFSRQLNHETSQMARVFPEPGIENTAIGIETGKMGQVFTCLMFNNVPDCCVFGYTQCFPLYRYERAAEQSRDQKTALLDTQSYDCGSDVVRVGDYIRRDNISDVTLQKFRVRYKTEPQSLDCECGTPHRSLVKQRFHRSTVGDADAQSKNYDSDLTKEDIFYYIYGLLHCRSYTERFTADLKKQLPRIPMVDDFWTFSKAGRVLAELHLNYETGKMYPLVEEVSSGGRAANYRVKKMKLTRHSTHATIHYNEHLTLNVIPLEAFRYIVNGRSAIEWILERYQISTHKESGIVNDPNDWCKEQGNDRYIVDLIKRVVYLSVESVRIIEELPTVEFLEEDNH